MYIRLCLFCLFFVGSEFYRNAWLKFNISNLETISLPSLDQHCFGTTVLRFDFWQDTSNNTSNPGFHFSTTSFLPLPHISILLLPTISALELVLFANRTRKNTGIPINKQKKIKGVAVSGPRLCFGPKFQSNS